MKKVIAGLTAVAVLAGCASTQGMGAAYRPLVDTKGVDTVALGRDTAECQAYARQTADAASAGAAGAVAGALLGAIFMAASGGRGFRNEAAAVGAISGGLGAASRAETDQRVLISRCLLGRGYKVLN